MEKVAKSNKRIRKKMCYLKGTINNIYGKDERFHIVSVRF